MNTLLNTQSLVLWNYTGSGHTGFQLQRSIDSGSTWTNVLSCLANTTSYYDNNIWWYSQSLYKVSAVNQYTSSSESLIASVFIFPPEIDVLSISGSQSKTYNLTASLSWSYSGSSQGSTLKLEVARSNNSGSSWDYIFFIDHPTLGSSSVIDTSVSSGSLYLYKMRAYCDFGLSGSYSNITPIYVSDVPTGSNPPYIVNYAAVSASFDIGSGGTCVPSIEPAWDGIFNFKTVWSGSNPLFTFTSQSFLNVKVAANDTPNWPSGSWQDTDSCAQIYWDDALSYWNLWIICTNSNLIWNGILTGKSILDPSGIYINDNTGSSIHPSTITISTA